MWGQSQGSNLKDSRSAYTENTVAHRMELAAATGQRVELPGTRVAWQGYSAVERVVEETMRQVGLRPGEVYFEAPTEPIGSYMLQLVHRGEMAGRYPLGITPRCRYFVMLELPMELPAQMQSFIPTTVLDETVSPVVQQLRSALGQLTESQLREAVEYAASFKPEEEVRGQASLAVTYTDKQVLSVEEEAALTWKEKDSLKWKAEKLAEGDPVPHSKIEEEEISLD